MHHTLPLALALTFSLPVALQAQDIPNGGFEDWTNTGNYIDPTGWVTSNMVSFSIDGTLTCEQGSPGAVGDHFVKVSDRMLVGAGMQQGSITIAQMGVPPGFPFTLRPEALNGFWQYHPQFGGHDGVVNAALTRWNTVTHQREVIANAPIHATTEISEWQSFSSPFLYYSPLYPDSAIVSVQATSAQSGDGTSIWVDELSFGQLTGVGEEASVAFALWPSPASDNLRISAGALLAEVIVTDMRGRVMSRSAFNQTVAVVSVATLPAGIYLADLRMADGRRAVRPFVKE